MHYSASAACFLQLSEDAKHKSYLKFFGARLLSATELFSFSSADIADSFSSLHD